MFNTEQRHYTRETKLWQGDEVQILWNTDVLCRWGHFCTTGAVSIWHLCSTISPLLQTKRDTTNTHGRCHIDRKNKNCLPLSINSFICFKRLFLFTFLMKLLLLWTRLKAGPIDWLELVSLETKGGAWTCSTSASSRGSSFNLLCWWSCDSVWKYLGL